MQVNGFPTVPVLQVTLLVTGVPPTMILLEAEALLTLFVSLATTLIVVAPFDEQVTEMLLVVDVPVHPAARVHVNV